MSDSKPCDGTCELAAARRRDAYNSLVHERDRLRDKVEAMAAKLRHSNSMTCDRCGASITVSSSVAVSDEALAAAIYAMASSAGWAVSKQTLEGLGFADRVGGNHDFCRHCNDIRPIA